MVPKDHCEHIKQYCIDRNNTWSKLYIERCTTQEAPSP